MKTNLLKKLALILCLIGIANINGYSQDVKAQGSAFGIAMEKTIVYTLSVGSFNQTADEVANWELSGQNSQDLGSIVSVVISGEDKVATITVTNELETQMAYMIQPLQSTMSAGYEMPDPVTIDVLAKADGTAEGIAGEMEITFTLTIGTFNMAFDRGRNRFSEIISNWELDGQDSQDLGTIVSIAIDSEGKLATVTVTNELETGRAYSLRPLQEAVSNNYVMPDPVPVSVSLATSVFDLKSQSVVVYPNPFDQSIFVEAGYSVQQIVVYNLAGQLVLDVLPSESNSIETESLPKGIYFVKVVGYDGVSQLFKMLKD